MNTRWLRPCFHYLYNLINTTSAQCYLVLCDIFTHFEIFTHLKRASNPLYFDIIYLNITSVVLLQFKIRLLQVYISHYAMLYAPRNWYTIALRTKKYKYTDILAIKSQLIFCECLFIYNINAI